MITEEQNVDQLFQMKLRDYEITPPAYLWNNIESELNAHKRTMKMILLNRAGFAAAVMLAFLAGWWMTGPTVPNPQDSNKSLTVNQKSELNSSTNNSQPLAKTAVSGNSSGEVVNKVSSGKVNLSGNEYKPSISSLATFAPNTSFLSKQSGISAMGAREPVLYDVEKEFLSYYHNNLQLFKELTDWVSFFKNDNNHPDSSRESKPVYQLNRQPNSNDRFVFTPDLKKDINHKTGNWVMSASVAPVFTSQKQSVGYSSMQRTSAETSMSGGMTAGYKIGKRIVIKTGILYSKLSQVTNNVDYTSIDQASGFQVKTSRAITPSGEVSLNKFTALKRELYLSKNYSLLKGYQADLRQEFGYIEIPVEASYKMIDHKFSIGLTGGISANILAGNKAGLFENGKRINSGETANLRDVSYSDAMGLELGYDLGNRITLTVGPRIKHFINSLSSNKTVDFKPNQLDIITGVTYSFN